MFFAAREDTLAIASAVLICTGSHTTTAYFTQGQDHIRGIQRQSYAYKCRYQISGSLFRGALFRWGSVETKSAAVLRRQPAS